MTGVAGEKPKKAAGPRLQHVAARVLVGLHNLPMQFDEVVVFGQKVDALEHIYRAEGDWVYAAVRHGQALTEALQGATS